MRGAKRRLGALVFAGLVAAGCASPTAVPVFSRTPAEKSAPDRLLASLARLRSLDDVALANEVARLRVAANARPDDTAYLEAALAVAVWPAGEDGEILARLAPVLRESPRAAPELRAMAGFLQDWVLERRKLRESAAAASAKSRDDRREALAQKQRAEAQQERADRLQQKLEALTDLEKSLSNRHADDPARRPR